MSNYRRAKTVAYAKMPEDIKTRNTLLFRDDIEKHPQYYEPLNKYIKLDAPVF
jgi:hypothetical protein